MSVTRSGEGRALGQYDVMRGETVTGLPQQTWAQRDRQRGRSGHERDERIRTHRPDIPLPYIPWMPRPRLGRISSQEAQVLTERTG